MGFASKNKGSLDRCVLCGAETSYSSDAPIKSRVGYVEGVGQLCPECARNVLHREFIENEPALGSRFIKQDEDSNYLRDFTGRLIMSEDSFRLRSPENAKARLGVYGLFFKRVLDFFLACFGLLVLSPLFLAVAIAIKRDSKGPVFFRQKRFGRDKRLFMIYKFRSMYTDVNPNAPTRLLSGAKSCITSVGAFLRKTSIDELPQIINILKGDMAIIGPRPVVESEVDLIVERDKYGANALRPGLTGWAQINGRDEVGVEQKALLDGEYARNMSLAFDFKCFFLTIYNVFAQKGITEGSEGFNEAEKRKRSNKTGH